MDHITQTYNTAYAQIVFDALYASSINSKEKLTIMLSNKRKIAKSNTVHVSMQQLSIAKYWLPHWMAINISAENLNATDKWFTEALRDVNCKIREIRIHKCKNFSDVKPLVAMQIGSIKRLYNILGGAHTITISECPSVVNVNPLCAIHKLIILRCNNVVDVSALHSVHTLHIEACKFIAGIELLVKVHTLTLANIDDLTDVTCFKSVNTLNLIECNAVTNISCLSTVRSVYIVNCNNVTDFEELKNSVRDDRTNITYIGMRTLDAKYHS